MDILIIVAMMVVTSVISILVTRRFLKGRFVGRLRIDRSDPDEPPYIFAELYKGVGDISGLKYVTFEICNENYLPPQK